MNARCAVENAYPRGALRGRESRGFSRHALPRQRGQALVEYVLLIGIAASVSLGFMFTFKDFMQQGILKFNAVLERDLRTGSYPDAGGPVGIWDN